MTKRKVITTAILLLPLITILLAVPVVVAYGKHEIYRNVRFRQGDQPTILRANNVVWEPDDNGKKHLGIQYGVIFRDHGSEHYEGHIRFELFPTFGELF